MEFTYVLDDISDIADKVLEIANHKILLFYGKMGVGKTTLIKAIAEKLGVVDNLSSPTFSIANEHILEVGKLYHFDFYRINSEDELLDLGVEEMLESGHWCLIEWPGKAESILPLNTTKITINTEDKESRTINICQ
jgi:tRNA threonylcarbamoyladenosine biosynthesis protein TsaE